GAFKGSDVPPVVQVGEGLLEHTCDLLGGVSDLGESFCALALPFVAEVVPEVKGIVVVIVKEHSVMFCLFCFFAAGKDVLYDVLVGEPRVAPSLFGFFG